jgi:hypothetical protein
MTDQKFLAISHDEFGRLRLATFLPADTLVKLNNWEYLGELWLGEAAGFTEWLRLESDPDVLRSVALDLVALPERAAQEILSSIQIPLCRGMSTAQIVDVLGNPVDTERFTDDRITLNYKLNPLDAYEVSCTVDDVQGLVYLTVHWLS